MARHASLQFTWRTSTRPHNFLPPKQRDSFNCPHDQFYCPRTGRTSLDPQSSMELRSDGAGREGGRSPESGGKTYNLGSPCGSGIAQVPPGHCSLENPTDALERIWNVRGQVSSIGISSHLAPLTNHFFAGGGVEGSGGSAPALDSFLGKQTHLILCFHHQSQFFHVFCCLPVPSTGDKKYILPGY